MKRKIVLIALILATSAIAVFAAKPGYVPGTAKAEYVPGEIIVKFKPSINISAAQMTNSSSINSILSKHKQIRSQKRSITLILKRPNENSRKEP